MSHKQHTHKPSRWFFEDKLIGIQKGGTGFPTNAEIGTIVEYQDGCEYRKMESGAWAQIYDIDEEKPTKIDPVNHPSHYTRFKGIEVIQLTEHLNFCRGNAVKYIARAGAKDGSKEIEDLEKARWYIDREIERLKND